MIFSLIVSYTFFLQSIVNGEIPEEVIPLFSDHETWVIPKGDSDFRPLGGVGVHRKLASTIALQDESTQSFNKSFFKDLQFGMDRLGTEKIVHSFRTFMEKYPEKDVLKKKSLWMQIMHSIAYAVKLRCMRSCYIIPPYFLFCSKCTGARQMDGSMA
jgi:hypothetical protein